MIINIPAIKNKYLRYTAATIVALIYLPVVFLLVTLINVVQEVSRAIYNMELKYLIQEDLSVLVKGIKQMYRGDK